MRSIPLLALLSFIVFYNSSSAQTNAIDRWTTTSGGSVGVRGNPASLTWGVVADGVTITGSEGTSPSDLRALLDSHFVPQGGGDSNQLWFPIFASAYNRWGEISGLSFAHQPLDSGAAIDNTTSPVGSATVPDMRIGGHSIDGTGNPNTLAYNYFPNHGDMVIDTDNTNLVTSTANSHRLLRNTMMHEIGHGIGLDHMDSSNAAILMEPFINTSFDGPQLHDILGAQRLYGDVFEKGVGNDLIGNATDLGSLAVNATISVGTDAGDTVVDPTDIDFISIDGSTGGADNDIDFLTFDLLGLADVIIDLTPLGPTYDQDGTPFNTSAQNDLRLELFDTDMVTSLGISNSGGLGDDESLSILGLAAGMYYVRISGTQDAAQFYQLDVSAVTPIPEPSSMILLGISLSSCIVVARRRMKKQAE